MQRLLIAGLAIRGCVSAHTFAQLIGERLPSLCVGVELVECVVDSAHELVALPEVDLSAFAAGAIPKIPLAEIRI